MKTRVTRLEDRTVVAIDGELDLGTAGELRAVLGVFLPEQHDPVVLDLAGLSFCDSAGLAVFVTAHNELESRGQQLIVARPSETVRRILDLTGLNTVIPTLASPDETIGKRS